MIHISAGQAFEPDPQAGGFSCECDNCHLPEIRRMPCWPEGLHFYQFILNSMTSKWEMDVLQGHLHSSLLLSNQTDFSRLRDRIVFICPFDVFICRGILLYFSNVGIYIDFSCYNFYTGTLKRTDLEYILSLRGQFFLWDLHSTYACGFIGASKDIRHILFPFKHKKFLCVHVCMYTCVRVGTRACICACASA